MITEPNIGYNSGIQVAAAEQLRSFVERIGDGMMKIKTITSQHRRDFYAIYECEHCGHAETGGGYDDANFHRNVVPKMKCKKCGKIAPADYRPLATKYPDGMQV